MKHYTKELFIQNHRLKLENRALKNLFDDVRRKTIDHGHFFPAYEKPLSAIKANAEEFINTVNSIIKERNELREKAKELERINKDLLNERYLDENGQFKEMM